MQSFPFHNDRQKAKLKNCELHKTLLASRLELIALCTEFVSFQHPLMDAKRFQVKNKTFFQTISSSDETISGHLPRNCCGLSSELTANAAVKS